MTEAKETPKTGELERYAVKYRMLANSDQKGVLYVMAANGVDAMKEGETACRKKGAELMSVIPDPE